MLAALSALLTVGLTMLPMAVALGKLAPRLFAFLRGLFGASKGAVGASGLFGIVMALLAFGGGIGFIVFIVMNFDLQIYMKLLNVVITPFSYVLRGMVSLLVAAMPSSMPANFTSLLGIFDFNAIISLLVLVFSVEFYLRLIMLYFVRRGR